MSQLMKVFMKTMLGKINLGPDNCFNSASHHLRLVVYLPISLGVQNLKKNKDSLYTDALNAMVRGDSDDAMRLLRNVVRQDTDHLDAYLQLGDILRGGRKSSTSYKGTPLPNGAPRP
ncbi:MAG: hypothetical protein CM1200mP10_13650 [Candidatus Neomarinimicrobiota bacterium]|nr:MAG: hypothetical protein CM1200mP10_13650 [Candidatus Neomarinimicrobiota bacterium]